MPFIRDWSVNYTTLTTGTTIVGLMPAYAQNDLILAIITADTYDATGGFTNTNNTGWSVFVPATTNTSYLTVLYKIAGASETDFTFTSTDSETYNIHMVTIGDVNTSSPFNGTGGGGTGYRTANNSASRVAMPVLTTTVNNSLIIYINSESGASVPGILEGAVIMEDAYDGNAHSDGFSWGFMPTAGATPTVYGNKSGTAAGVIATLGISPPSGGATVIPTYCAGDASIYVDPIHGTTAYNGNGVFTTTNLTTTFGTVVTSGTNTLTTGTAGVGADVGLNSFHSMGQITPATTANVYYGAMLAPAVANQPNVSGKNVICHVKPATPKTYQTTDAVNDAAIGKGIIFGMCSSANTNYRWWHVHGAGTKWDTAQHVPIVIHMDNTSGRIHNTGTLGSTITHFGFGVSNFTTAAVFQFGSLWVLDTTTVAGGNAANPVRVPGIVKACALGKERMSIIQSGASQMLLMQPIQFGNGGTNPIYLDLDGTAIEVPQHYSVADRQVFYCSADNVAGVTYYAGASDTIKHRNSVISSKNRFKWGLHASSNTSATYDFSGLSVIGAGTISLARAITIDGLTINDYSTLDVSGLTLTNSVIKNPPATNASITTSASSNIDYCDINTSTVTAGNHWWTGTDPSIFTYCNFTGGGGYAMNITAAGGSTVSLIGNKFSGYGANNTNTAALNFTATSGTITLSISGGGDTPTYNKPAGLTVNVSNPVSVSVTVKDAATLAAVENARVRIVTTVGGNVVLEGVTNNLGVLTGTTNYVGSAVTGTVRRATPGTSYPPIDSLSGYGRRYKPYSISDTVGAGGLSVSALLASDE